MKKLFMFTIAWATALNVHASISLPQVCAPHLLTPKWDENLFSPRISTSGLKSRYQTVRIKVFPHNSLYTGPQGPETVADSVTLTSKDQCHLYPALTASSENGFDASHILASGTSFVVQAKRLTQAVWLRCKSPVTVQRQGLKIKSLAYVGDLFIKKVAPPGAAPYLTIVNVVSFDDYLMGVIPSEVPATWPHETLKAQAVAARTYAYFELDSNDVANDVAIQLEQSGAQLDDTVDYQAYMGLANVTAPTNAAVVQTRDQVLTHAGAIAKTYFHADSGGHTEDAVNVWGIPLPYAIGIDDPASAGRGSNWQKLLDFATIQGRLCENGAIATGSDLVHLSMATTFPSGRIRSLDLHLSDGTVQQISGVQFAYAVGLRSNWFSISERGNEVTIAGRGWGHGVGMSQLGARALAQSSHRTFADILHFYYTGVSIGPLP